MANIGMREQIADFWQVKSFTEIKIIEDISGESTIIQKHHPLVVRRQIIWKSLKYSYLGEPNTDGYDQKQDCAKQDREK